MVEVCLLNFVQYVLFCASSLYAKAGLSVLYVTSALLSSTLKSLLTRANCYFLVDGANLRSLLTMKVKNFILKLNITLKTSLFC